MKKTVKRIVSMVLVFVLVFSALTIIPGEVLHSWYASAAELITGEASAEETFEAGDYTYSLINEYANVKIVSYKGSDAELVIPKKLDGKTVTAIGDKAFQGMSFITSVILPDTIETIGGSAFNGCSNMESINLGNSLKTIGGWAFYNCTSLTALTTPASLEKIDGEAFYRCTGLKTIELYGNNLLLNSWCFDTIPAAETIIMHEGIKTINERAFTDLRSLTALTLPDSLEIIGNRGFSGAVKLESVTFGKGLTSVGEYAFADAVSLKTVKVNAACAKLPTNAFTNDTALESIEVDKNSQTFASVDGALLNKEKTKILLYPKSKAGAFTIPNTVTELAAESFSNCPNLTEINIGSGITEIPTKAFYSCAALEKAVIGNNVTTIGNNAFAACPKLAEVTFGRSIKTIGDSAFHNCSALAAVNLPDSVETIGGSAFNGCSAMATLNLGNSLKTIGGWAFYNCTSLTALTTPASLEKIDGEAFYRCTGLKTIELYGNNLLLNSWCFDTIPAAETIIMHEGIKTINERAFTDLRSLTALTLPDSLETIGNRGFSGAVKLESVTFGKGLTSVGEYAFADAVSLKTVKVNAACAKLPTNAFTNDTALESIEVDKNSQTFASVDGALLNKEKTKILLYPKSKAGAFTIPNTVTELAAESFSNCPNLTEITIGSGITEIPTKAFYSCAALEKAVIGNNVTTIGNNAFAACSKLAEVTFGKSVNTIGDSAFHNCSALAAVNLPNSVETIGGSAFNGCSAMATLNLGNSLKIIGGWAFYNCTSLTALTTPASLEKIDGEAFYRCTGLKTIELYGNDLLLNSWCFDTIPAAETIIMHEGIKTINERAFTDLRSLTALTLPDSLETIGNRGFSGAVKLESVTFGKGLTSVGEYAFADAVSLKTVKVNAACAKLPTNAFTNDTALESIEVDKNSQTFASVDGALLNKEKTKILLYPKSKAGAFTIPNTVTELAAESFSNCPNLTEITIGSGITEIPTKAFYSCAALEKAVIGNNVTTIGNNAFAACPKLAEVTFGRSIKTIGDSAFHNCSALAAVNLPDSAETIGGSAFNGCSAMATLNLGNSLKTIGGWAFYNCTSLTALTTPASLEKIDGEAFYRCTGLKTIELYGNDLLLNSWCFDTIPAAETIIMHEGVKTINGNVFSNAKELKTLTFPKSIDTIDENAIKGYTAITAFCHEDSPAHTYLKKLNNVTICFIADNFFIVDPTIDKLSSGSVTLKWKKPNGYDNIDHYIIYKDGVKYDEATQTSYTDDDISAGNTYTYEISAVDNSGLVSERKAIDVTPACSAVTALNLPGGKTAIGGTKPVALSATMENGLARDGAKGEFIYSSDGEGWLIACSAIADSDGVNYTGNWDLKDIASGNYTLRFRFTDKNGAVTFKDAAVSVDRTAPAKIDSVGIVPQETKISLNWIISTEHDTERYRIYRAAGDGDFELISEIQKREILHYDDVKVAKNTVYRYYIVGVDPFNQESETYDVVSACLTGDTMAPSIKRIQPNSGATIAGKKTFTVTASDNVGVTRTELYCSSDPEAPLESWKLVCEKNGSAFSEPVDTANMPYGIVYIVAKVYDAAGNVGISDSYRYMCDNKGPDKVAHVKLEENLGTKIVLSWLRPEEDDTAYFIVEVKQPDGSFKQIGEKQSRYLYQTITGLIPETEYTMQVVPYDQNGNRGTPSDPIVLTTSGDMICPKVTKATATSNTYGYASERIDFSVYASDDYQLAKIEIQSSLDKKKWTTIKAFAPEHNNREQSFSYTYNVSGMNEGELYIRMVAEDTAGNSSLENVTEILTYHIDRTNTAVPENVSASSDKEYIAVSWNEPDDNTVVGFNIMRCDSEDGNYKEIRTNTNAVLIYDEDVVPGKTYWYKVQSVDKAGNLSAFSAPVSCTVTPDTSAPRINGFTPAVNSKLSPSYPTVNIEVIDNSMLTNLKVEYKVNGLLSFYTVLKEVKDNTSKKCNVDVKLPIEDLNNGDSVTLLINATDGAGNTMEPKKLTYTIDKEAPELKNVKVSHTDKKNTVTWESSSTDTNKFYVMRKTSEDGEFIAISAIDHDNGKTSYSFTDNDLSDDTYFKYRVVAYDDVRNHRESDTDEVIVEHPSWVYTHLDFSEYQIEGKEYSYDMSGTETATSITEYNYDFGDGCVITTTDEYVWHMYDYAGTYDVRVTAKDEDGNTCTSEGTVYVQAPSLSGHVTVCVQDENGRSVSGAEVYLDGVTSCYYPTNSAGCAEFDLPLGIHTFVAFKDHYSPMSAQTVSVDGGDQIVYVPIRNKELVTCEFNVKKMSFEEIKKAGIDLDDENNYREGMLKFDMKFVSEGEPTEATYYYGGGKLYGKPVYVYVGKNTPTPEKRVITPMIIGVGDEENPLLAFLDVPDMPYKAVKDFFDVNLTVYNNASRDYYLAGSQVTLNPSRGLSIVTDSTDSRVSKSRTVSLGTIPGGGSASARWILRGDEAGVYGLSADFTGTLSYFNRPISAHFTYNGKITVSKTPLAAELQISKTANSKGEIFFNLVIENTGSSSIELPYGAMNFAESFSDELISSSGVSCEIAKRGTNVLGAGCKLVYHFRSKQSVLDEFRKSLMQTFSMADVGFKVTYFDDGVFRDRYEKKYPKEAFVFKVINSEGKPLKGAKIDIGTTNFTTDSNGQVTIRGSETEEIEAKFLKVTCPGYVIHRDENFVGALYGPGKTITLYKEDDFDISSVDMNGVDVLCNRTNLYVDETLSDDSPARVSFVVQLKGQPASSIKFTQNGNKEIAPIKTNYDKSNNRYTFITYVSYIKECTPITIEAVSPVGKLLIKTLKVSPIHGRYGFGVHMPGLPGIDMDKAGLEWLSGINLGFPISGSSSFSYAYDRNKDIHAVTLSTTSPFNIWEKSTTAATETAFGTITETVTETTTIPGFSDMMEMFKKNIKDAKNGKDLNSINHISKGGMDYGAAVYYKIVGEKIEVVEAKIFVVFYAEYKYQTVISPVVLPVPLTLCLGFSGSIQGDLGAKFDDNDLHKITPYGSVSGSVSITPSIAVGIPMLNVGLYGMLTLSAMGILDTSVAEAYWDYVKLSGEFGITYEVGVFSGTFPIVSGDIATLYEHKASGDVGAMFDISGYTINNKLLEYNSVWSKPAVLDNGTSTLIDNVDNAEKPQLVKVGDKTVMVYRAVDKEVTSAANSLALYYSIYDPAKLSWSKPVKLDQNHCSDINFKLSSNGVSAQVIYSQVNGELGDDVTLTDFFKKTDIYSASFDPETNRFDAPVKVSDNNIGDANPIVKYIGNTPTAVWVENSNNNIFLNDNSNKLMMSRCINGAWTKPVNIGSGIANLLDFDIVENGKTESVVYITDTDGNMNTTHDRPLTIYNFVSDEQQTVCEDAGAGFTTCIFRNRSSVLWQKNGVMMCYDVASGRSIQLCGRFFAAATDVQMLDNDGEYQLVYVDGSKSVCMITYNSVTNSWSNPVTLAESSNFIQNMTAAYIDGKLSLTYHETQVLDKDYNTQSALIQTVIDSKPNLTINKIKADYDTVREGKETTVYVNVTNNGIQPTGDLTFTVNNYDGKMLGKINVKDSALGVGETKSVPVRFTAPDNIFDCDLHITVSDEPYYNPDGTVGASIFELTRVASGVTDSDSFNLGCSDVQVRATEYIDGAKPYIRAVVSNNTDYETPVRLEVYNYSTDEVYYTRNIPSVSSERSLTFDIPLEESYADENGYIAVRVIPTANDADDDNNFDLFAYFDPAMVVGDANLDGKLTIDDVTMIQKHLAGYKQLQGKALKNCDTNKDGKVDISDATRIQLYLSQFTNVNMGYCGMSF